MSCYELLEYAISEFQPSPKSLIPSSIFDFIRILLGCLISELFQLSHYLSYDPCTQFPFPTQVRSQPEPEAAHHGEEGGGGEGADEPAAPGLQGQAEGERRRVEEQDGQNVEATYPVDESIIAVKKNN